MQGGAGPPSRNPPVVWDIGGASGASPSGLGATPGVQGRRTHSLVQSTFLPPNARGGRPPLPEPPRCLGHWGRLRRIPSGLRATPGVQGRRTHSLVRSRLVTPNARGGRPPLPEPPRCLGHWGRLRRIPFGSGGDARGPGKTDSLARAKHIPTPECKGGQAPPSGTPPLSGTLGAPPAHPFGSAGDARGPGKTDPLARAKQISNPECKGGQAPPPGTPPLSGTLGAPPAHPLRVWGRRQGSREDGLTRSCKAHSYPRMQGGAGPPFRNSPVVWDIGGASGASLRVCGRRQGSREDGPTRSCEAD